jgi:putative hydrolase of the HAD superfamily
MTTVVRACLIDVYDTILISQFVPRMAAVIEPLGIDLDVWLAEYDTMREDRDRGKMTVAASFERTLRALGVDPEPELVADLSRRDAEFMRSHIKLCDDTVPFLSWLRSRGVLSALVSNCADPTRALLANLGIIPLVDAVVLSCEVGSMKPYPEIYVTALEELGVAAVDAVFIDDQPSFCVGAQAVGVRPIQIARGQPDGYASPWDFPVIRALPEAKPLLS